MKRLTFVCSALLVACAVFGSDISDFRDSVAAAGSQEELQEVFDNAPESVRVDTSYQFYFEEPIDQRLDSPDYYGFVWSDVQQWAIDDVNARIAKESVESGGQLEDPRAVASEILSNPIYVDPQKKEGRNWVSDTGRRFSNWLEDWLSQFQPDDTNLGSSGPELAPFAFMFGGLKFIMWAILIIGVAIALYFALRNFTGIGRKKRVGGILEDDEPERTADQWLLQAEKLEAEGKYREAIRCLYLACLVRFDDGGVARFRRHETNWEHLYRIEGSPERPTDIDFRHTTQRFDKIWYGHQIEGQSDVHEFKEVYKKICLAMDIKKAA